MMNDFGGRYRGKRVLVTGHTGFKGSWLTLWLCSLGAEVTGVSAYLPSDPCNFDILGLEKRMNHVTADVRDIEAMKRAFDEARPEIVFHMAAQAIVKEAFADPMKTFNTNAIGTMNVLECIRSTPGIETAVIITSDKCYQNVEWPWGYRETDKLGGDDPYSASKACAEIVANSYIKSFFNPSTGTQTRIATTRAGNVIGGGDWAAYRIVPDCVRAWAGGEEVVIRSPEATRPWQHVMEPLSGYLWLGARLIESGELHGEAFNFGPDAKVNQSVRELIEVFLNYWKDGSWRHEKSTDNKKENFLLKLSCDKALHYLDWHALLDFEDTVRLTAEWYRAYYGRSEDMFDFTADQLTYYVGKAREARMPWATTEVVG